MIKFELTVLGSNAAMPAHGRHLSAQVLNVDEELFLIDCGEGTQMQMQRFGVRKHKINHIFITHIHGDHMFGLIGLIMTFGLTSRKAPLHIYSPKGVQSIIEMQLGQEIGFPIVFHTTNPEKHELIHESKKVKVFTIPLDHRVPCNGYLFEEQDRLPNMRADKIKEYGIPYQVIKEIKEGNDFVTADGTTVPHDDLVIAAPKARKFAYCSDTSYKEAILPIIKEVNLLYHETTFLHELEEQAFKTKHTTAWQAATLAKKANAQKLLVGHFSSRYHSIMPFLYEARAVFPESYVAREGETFIVKH